MGKKRFRIGFFTAVGNQTYQSDLLAGVVESAIKNDVDIIRFAHEFDYSFYKLDNQFDILTSIAGKYNLDGILTLGWATSAEKLMSVFSKNKEIPIISLGVGLQNFISVFQDGKRYLIELIDHLVNHHKYKNIVFICPVNDDSRVDIFISEMNRYGLYNKDYIVYREDLSLNEWDIQDRVLKIEDILFNQRNLNIDAIISLYADEAILLHERLAKRNIRVPEDIALVSWEESDTCRNHTPPITTVYYPFYEIGYTGCDVLVNLLNGNKVKNDYAVQSKIFYRKSCGCNYSAFKKVKDDVVEIKDSLYFIDDKTRNGIIGLLTREMTILEGKELYTQFEQSLKQNNSDYFCLWFEEHCKDKYFSIEQLDMIQEDILILRKHTMPYIIINKNLNIVSNNVWTKIQIIINSWIEKAAKMSENNRNMFVSEWMNDIGFDLITSFDYNKIVKILDDNLGKLKIKNCFLYRLKKDSKNEYFQKCFYRFFYENSNSSENYDYEHDFDAFEKNSEQVELDIEKMFEGDRHTYLFHILHVRNELVGCAFYEYGVRDDRIYSSLSVQLSAALKSAEVLKKLEKSNIELSKLDKLKNDFIANITHDFRSPLMIILNNSDIALKYTNIDEATHKRYSVIYEAALMLRSTTDRMLDLVKLDAQGLKVNAKKTKICNFIDNISDFYKSALLSSNISVVKKINVHDDHIYTDLVVLEEVLNNIISNAIKFVDPLKGEIYIELEETNNCIRIIIGDNGIGIAKDKLEVIFGRFEQIESGMNSKYKGTGIGLAFSKQLVEHIKGKIWAESKGVGYGSRFIIELPKGEDIFSPDEIDNNTSYETRSSEFKNLLQIELKNRFDNNGIEVHFKELNKENEFNYKKAVILVVDDNKQIREIVCEYLCNNGYFNWITAGDGLQGIEAAYHYRPDLILCDYNMPNMKGDQFHDELLCNPDFKRIPFIFLSALADRKVIFDRKRKGAIDYLSKPVNEAELLLSLDIHLQQYMELKSTLYMATIDELTGINNKRNLNKLLSAQFSIRKLRDISIIFLDLDFFKLINDTYGHPAGDSVLKEVGKILRDTLRPYDIYGRYGGEEFLIALPETSEDNAIIVAEKLRKRIEASKIIHNGIDIKITSSFGIVSLMKNERYICEKIGIPNLKGLFEIDPKEVKNWDSLDENKFQVSNLLISIADTALYEAKSTKCNKCGYSSVKKSDFLDNKCSKCGSGEISIGRNRCVVFDDSINLDSKT